MLLLEMIEEKRQGLEVVDMVLALRTRCAGHDCSADGLGVADHGPISR